MDSTLMSAQATTQCSWTCALVMTAHLCYYSDSNRLKTARSSVEW